MILGFTPLGSFATVMDRVEDKETIELKKQLGRISLDGISENLILSNLRTLDIFDNILEFVNEDQTVNTMIDIKNISNNTQNFALVIATDSNNGFSFSHEWIKLQLEPQEIFVYNHTWTLHNPIGHKITFAVSTDSIKKDFISGLELLLLPTGEISSLIIDKKIPYKSLKKQLQEKVEFNDIQCNNPNHNLVTRTNGNLACVTEKLSDKLNWKIVDKIIQKIIYQFPLSTNDLKTERLMMHLPEYLVKKVLTEKELQELCQFETEETEIEECSLFKEEPDETENKSIKQSS